MRVLAEAVHGPSAFEPSRSHEHSTRGIVNYVAANQRNGQLSKSIYGLHSLTGLHFYKEKPDVVICRNHHFLNQQQLQQRPRQPAVTYVGNLRKALAVAKTGSTILVARDLEEKDAFQIKPLFVSTPVRLVGATKPPPPPASLSPNSKRKMATRLRKPAGSPKHSSSGKRISSPNNRSRPSQQQWMSPSTHDIGSRRSTGRSMGRSSSSRSRVRPDSNRNNNVLQLRDLQRQQHGTQAHANITLAPLSYPPVQRQRQQQEEEYDKQQAVCVISYPLDRFSLCFFS